MSVTSNNLEWENILIRTERKKNVCVDCNRHKMWLFNKILLSRIVSEKPFFICRLNKISDKKKMSNRRHAYTYCRSNIDRPFLAIRRHRVYGPPSAHLSYQALFLDTTVGQRKKGVKLGYVIEFKYQIINKSIESYQI